jgi:hypothetical protein
VVLVVNLTGMIEYSLTIRPNDLSDEDLVFSSKYYYLWCIWAIVISFVGRRYLGGENGSEVSGENGNYVRASGYIEITVVIKLEKQHLSCAILHAFCEVLRCAIEHR